MSRTVKDLTGQRFGRLTVVSLAYSKQYATGSKPYWHCQCECGQSRVLQGRSLVSGNTKSCGCLLTETRGKATIKHGLASHPIYSVWRDMMYRCYNKKFKQFKDYGGRGIKVCNSWLDVSNFVNDMFPTYVKGLTLERINNDGDYTPSNCKWADWIEQASNRRTL